MFLNDTSVTGLEIASRDWSGTPLGSIEGWPPALRTTLALMLASPTPMFLAWGPDLRCFFNDAYRPILGYRLQSALGRPFREVWSTIWSDIEPLVNAALAGESQIVTDMRLDVSRSGAPEESWWTFTYSPAYYDDGSIAGLFCVTGETTSRVVAERDRDAADDRLELALSAGNSIGVWDWDVINDRLTADTRFATLYGVEPDQAAKGAPIAEFFNGIHPDDLPRVQAEIGRVMAGDGNFASEYRLLDKDGTIRWVAAQGRCIFDDEGKCVRFPGASYDITQRMVSDLALKAAKAEREFVIDLTVAQRKLSDPEAIIRLSAEMLGHRLGINRVGYYRLVGAKHLRHGCNWTDGTLAPLTGIEPASRFGKRAEQLRRRGKTLVFSDSRHDDEHDFLPLADQGVLSGVCVPLMQEGVWQAGMYLHHAEVRHWTAAEIALAKEVADLTWLAVDRAEAVMRLNQLVDKQNAALVEASTEIKSEATARSAAELQVRQLQKMEAVGQLTGGIAHDFNNMLAVVIGGLNLAQRRLDRGETDIKRFMDGAMEGATRAAALTQRLLAFSRQQPLAPESIEANRLVNGLTELLARTLGERVRLETILTPGLWKTLADPVQLENVIVNLAVNARDAMPDGGRLTIETGNADVDADYALEAEVPDGHYVMIAVSDTGTGMSQEVLAKAFEPFFTTKGVGKGTGLGLSQVFGFVRQSGGHVKIYSEVGHGTTIKVYLPRTLDGEMQPVTRRAPVLTRAGSPDEIIMVVEDEERVRNFSTEALRELGYTVLHADSGPAALALIDTGQDVTLLFTDVVMPEMTGRQLADEAIKRLPDLKVVYTTGYTRNAIVHNGVIDPGTNFLAKPFGIDQLAAKIREALDG